MKDEHTRRRRAELELIRPLPDVEPNLVFKPIHQESLKIDYECAGIEVWVQGNEFVVTSTDQWCLQVYVLDRAGNTAKLNDDSDSDISDDGLIPSHLRNPLWCAIPREVGYYEKPSSFAFIAPDVIGFISSANVSTWYVRSGEQLESITIRGAHLESAIFKINDSEFVTGSAEGHIIYLAHKRGCNLREIMRVRKAHLGKINCMTVHKNLIVSTSTDCSARLWDTTTKKRLAVLKHGAPVVGVALSDEYIVTCSFTETDNGEIRIFKNEDGYQLMKILHMRNWVYKPKILNDGPILFRFFRPFDDESLHRHYLCIVDFEHERYLAQLNVGVRKINDYDVLADGRIIVVGQICGGVVATLPRRPRKLVRPKILNNNANGRTNKMCVLM